MKKESGKGCGDGTVYFCTGKRVFINLKDVSYEDFPRFVNGSASIPIFTEAIEIDSPFTDFEGTEFTDRVFLFDGGVRDHSPTHKVICCQGLGITETCTIFSRPEDYNILFPGYFPKNIIKVLERYVDISNTEVSKNDEALEINYIKTEHLVNRGIFFLPKVMESLYDVDKGRLKKLYEEGKKVVQKNWKADLTPA